MSTISWTRITVLIDNEPNEDLINEWGLSMWVETPLWRCLFDAGTNPSTLKHNMSKLKIDPSRLDFAVLSHHHYDHLGGFSYIGEEVPNLTVYIPPNSKEKLESWSLKPQIINETKKIAEDAYIIGPLEAWTGFREIALAINVDEIGLIVLVGCSHPGVDNIVLKTLEDLGREIYAIIGGFHKPSKKALDKVAKIVKRIFPAHCTGSNSKRYLIKNYPDKYGEIRTGTILEFSTTNLP